MASASAFLQQEPRPRFVENSARNVEEGVAEIKALLARYDEINAKVRRGPLPGGDGPSSSRSRDGFRIAIEAANGWDARLAPGARHGRAAAPAA